MVNNKKKKGSKLQTEKSSVHVAVLRTLQDATKFKNSSSLYPISIPEARILKEQCLARIPCRDSIFCVCNLKSNTTESEE